GSNLNIVINNNWLYYSSAGFDNSLWHLLVITVDSFAPRTKAYLNKALIVDSSIIPTSNYSENIIGDWKGNRQCNCMLGYTATYDHILSQEEIDNIYESFLVDSNNPANFPFAEVSGRVFDHGGSPLDQADVIAFDSASDAIVAQDTTTSGGEYLLQFEAAGSFKVIASKTGVLGGRVAEATVSGGTVTFVTD
ncbi:MAG: hypothetical protein DRQ39_11125, partial [Gammaproteobacteria bacterium]